jgi:nucleoside-diphosphate-sugar epimerase
MNRSPTTVQLLVDEIVRLSRSVEDEIRETGSISGPRFAEMEQATRQLILEKDRLGELKDPYETIMNRSVSVSPEVCTYLTGKRILVTGAAGEIGSGLCDRLAGYDPSLIILVDRDQNGLARVQARLADHSRHVTVESCLADVASRDEFGSIFDPVRPHVVFHLAAEREPGRAEASVRDAILTNIRGTENAARCAALSGIERFIHASTGKCRFLYEDRVYPATKKFAEVMIKIVADETPGTRFSLVRFHHVVDNSIVERRFRDQIARGEPLTVHLPPDRMKHGQSLAEAVAMLLNAGLVGERGEVFGSTRQMDYFTVLDLALYLIKNAEARLPIRFTEPSKSEGYEIEEFAGTRRSPDEQNLTHSFNTIETTDWQVLEKLGLIVTPFPDFDQANALSLAHDVLNFTAEGDRTGDDMKQMLYGNLFQFAEDVYRRAPAHLLVDALTRGVESDIDTHRRDVERHAATFKLLLKGLAGRPPEEVPVHRHDELRSALINLRMAVGEREEHREIARLIDEIRA